MQQVMTLAPKHFDLLNSDLAAARPGPQTKRPALSGGALVHLYGEENYSAAMAAAFTSISAPVFTPKLMVCR